MDVADAIRRFSKTPLKHRMSKYLLEYLLENTELLHKIRIVNTRAYLPDTMMIAQAGVEGPPFELELGAVERDEVSMVNGRLVKQKRKNRAIWINDPVQAVEVLRKFTGILYVEFRFAGEIPDWYRQIVAEFKAECVMESEVTQLIREQVELLLSGIILKNEIDRALQQGDQQLFQIKVQQYKQICERCLWEF
ncbi:MAG TPA: hypothetical protein GX739_00145 [Firmicutes bacterium]|nr:hypothetical protein [Bacillota bacterium]